LKLKYEEWLSNVAFNCKLRHYSEEEKAERRKQIQSNIGEDLLMVSKVGRCTFRAPRLRAPRWTPGSPQVDPGFTPGGPQVDPACFQLQHA